MKKSILLLAFGALFTSVNAQDKPGAGKIFVGGSLGYGSSSQKVLDETVTTGNLNISPSLGYFINDGMAIGANLSFSKQIAKGIEKGGVSFGVGAFLRKYWSLADNFYFIGEASADFSSTTPANAEKAGTGFGVGITPGLGFYPGKKWGVEFAMGNVLGFSSSKPDPDADATTNINVGFSTAVPAISVIYFLK